MNEWKWWYNNYGSECLGIGPTTKIPSIKTAHGWLPQRGWPTFRMPREKAIEASRNGANVGLQTRIYHAIDCDVDNPKFAAEIEALTHEHIGDTSIRFRENSPRWLFLCRLAEGHSPLRKQRLPFMIGDQEHAVELLADKNQTVVAGIHPSGARICWRNGHPCERTPAGLAEVTKEKIDAFFAELADLLNMYGYPIVSKKGSTANGGGARKKIGDPEHTANPQLIFDALKVWQNTAENVSTHEDFVAAVAAIKAGLGNECENYYPEFAEWALGYEQNNEDYVRRTWESIRDSALGANWLFAQARKAGFHGDAQAAFDDNSDPNAGIKLTPYDQMLGRYVWVKGLGQYNDTHDGSFLDSKNFNASNVDVKPFGSSGQQSAEAAFQNAKGARKVATATSRPGEPVILQEQNDRGIPVKAVNLWRPSIVKPDLSVTGAEVAPWLDLVRLIFGPEGAPEREHFLNWWGFVLQHPGEKIGHAVVIIGGQGVGKDTVLRPLFEAVGLHNVASIDTATLFGQWTYFLRSQIVYCQEMITYGRRDLYNALKPYISAQATRLAVNEKNLRQYFVPNNQNWIVTGNHDNAIALEDDDRRFWVHRSFTDEPPPSDYFSKLHAWLKSGGTERVFGWLKQRDLSGFDPMAKPPITAAKRTMLEASQPKPVRFLREQLREGGRLAGRAVLTAEELMIIANGDYDAPPQRATVQHSMTALRAEGFKSAHRVRLDNVGMKTLWARGLDGAMTADAMRKLYVKERGGR